MKKRKQAKSKVAARWEILRTFDNVVEKYGENADIPSSDTQFFKENFQGNYIDLLFSKRIDPQQSWNVKINTRLRTDDGQEGWHECEFKISEKMTLNEVLKGNPAIKFNNNGIKTRWKGVTLMWIGEIENDVPNSTCLEAWVTATCDSLIKPVNTFDFLQKVVA